MPPRLTASIKATRTAKVFSKNSMNKFLLTVIFLLTSCAGNSQKNAEAPSWYLTPKQNNSQNLYGTAQGQTLEEATKYALADAASRLMVSISSESNLLREENENSVNEEMRQNVRSNIEKIDFTNFEVTRSEKSGADIYVEVKIERDSFLQQQKERVNFLEKKISDLDKDSAKKNPIQRRNSLIKILDLCKELELKSRILAGAGENIKLKDKLTQIAIYQNQFDKTSDKIEFYFEMNSPKEIAQIIRTGLNKEKIKTSPSRNPSNPNQIIIKINSESRDYEKGGDSSYDFATKIKINFESIAEGKTVSSNIVEVTGHSIIGLKEAHAAALSELEEKITKDGILKIIGITN